MAKFFKFLRTLFLCPAISVMRGPEVFIMWSFHNVDFITLCDACIPNSLALKEAYLQ
jgi:hypothetical protein